MWCDDDVGLLADGAADLVGNRDVLAIVAAGGPDPASALKNETTKQGITKPIVFTTVADPVHQRTCVKDFNKPGNIRPEWPGRTSELDAARLMLLSAFIGGRARRQVRRAPVSTTRDDGDDQYSKMSRPAKRSGSAS